ncbi:hypothetical protein V1508DRAFT_447524 [Lipomyces doorenjongii]|uniref:uncharacterized protein n=1 Tax=Lipomyces doorenjongii TaxID=383834 RepID=UPI0034CF7B89
MRMRIIFVYSQGFSSQTSFNINLDSMADSESEILSDSGVDDFSVGSLKRPKRARPLDYRLINDGSDDEAAPEDRMVKSGRFPSPLDSSESIAPDDSASQLSQDTPCSAQRQNTLLWSYYNVSSIPGKLWCPMRGKKGPLLDNEIQCRLCSWKATDSARASSTTNMRLHINEHRLEPSNDNNDHGDHQHTRKQQSIATIFKKQSEQNIAKTLEQNLVRWTVTDHMAFMSIESQAFQQIFRDLPGVSLPITSRITMLAD